MTREEAWSGVKPLVDYLRVFGCVGHVHIPDAKRSKLENKCNMCFILNQQRIQRIQRL